MKNYFISIAVAALLAACGGGNPDSTARAPKAMRVAQGGAVPAAAVNVNVFTGIRSNYTISATEAGYTIVDQTGVDAVQFVPLGASTAQFADLMVSFDTAGGAGQLYRLTLAATGLAPTSQNLGLALKRIADGVALNTLVAELMASTEYLALYGSNQDDAAFVASLYVNILHRQPDASGMSDWLSALASGMTRAAVLMAFSESPENVAQVAPQIANGIEYIASPRPGSPTQTSWAKSVSLGNGFACALTTVGGVKCWGANSSGQLGNGVRTTVATPSPVDVIGLASGVKSLQVGYQHACALTASNQIKCWGAGGFGQLGDGVERSATYGSPVPVTVVAPAGAAEPSTPVALTTGANHNCMLTAAGEVYCWGDGSSGILTSRVTKYTWTPVPVADVAGTKLAGVKKIRAGKTHTCALTESGGVKCFGLNPVGNVGNGKTTATPYVVDVVGLASGVTDISVGNLFSCAVVTGGTVKCWGRISQDLGGTPVSMAGFANVTAFAQGGSGSMTVCGFAPPGTVNCLGVNNYGQLGNWVKGAASMTAIAAYVDGLKLTSYVTESGDTCAIAQDGKLMCWGAGSMGQLGDGVTTPDTAALSVHYVKGFN